MIFFVYNKGDSTMANKWLEFLKSYRKKHPSLSMKEAMKAASKEYKKAPAKAKGRKKKR